LIYCIIFSDFIFSVTNEAVILFLILIFSVILFFGLLKPETQSLFLIPNRWQLILESIYKLVLNLVIDNIKDARSQKFFPLLFFIFLFVVSLNVIGLVPYSFTLTSHLVVTFYFSLLIFIGINIIGFQNHGLKFFAIFFPSGTSIILGLLLVPIEVISHIFKPISLSIRLFANMMAGHTLVKVIAGFAFSLMSFTGILFFFHYIPLFILLPLFFLELGVALIQAFVFSILISIYLNDSINLH
jgi:ATP synthase subunit 6